MLKDLRNAAGQVDFVEFLSKGLVNVLNHFCLSINSQCRRAAKDKDEVEYHGCWQKISVATCITLDFEFFQILVVFILFVLTGLGSFHLLILLLEVFGNLFVSSGVATAVIFWIENLSTAREKSEMKRVREHSGEGPYHVFNLPKSVESCLLVVLVDYDYLCAVFLHPVASKDVADECFLVLALF